MSSLKVFALLSVSCFCASAQDDWRTALQKKVLSKFTLTKVTANKATIVTAGTVIVLKKDDLVLYNTGFTYPNGNTYKDGRITQGFFGTLSKTAKDGSIRTFVAGEKLWFTKISFESKGDGVTFEFVSDPFDDVRYWGTLKFTWPKGMPPEPDAFAATVAQVMQPDTSAPAAAAAPAEVAPQAIAPPAPAPPPAPVVEQAAPPPIAPPPPPPDQAPPTISLGQTKDQVTANFGQPARIANLGPKQILYYKDFKVTLTNGKVTDIQ